MLYRHKHNNQNNFIAFLMLIHFLELCSKFFFAILYLNFVNYSRTEVIQSRLNMLFLLLQLRKLEIFRNNPVFAHRVYYIPPKLYIYLIDKTMAEWNQILSQEQHHFILEWAIYCLFSLCFENVQQFVHLFCKIVSFPSCHFYA